MGAAGIWNHTMAAVNPLKSASPMSSGTGGSSSGDASTISANDFLTLLVTEMKNQDPTANTDPNEYINQLVQVNSLEQLISINQNLSTALGTSTSGATAKGGATGNASGSPQALNINRTATAGASLASPAASAIGANSGDSVHSVRVRANSGNLSVPSAMPAAQRVAQALSGHK